MFYFSSLSLTNSSPLALSSLTIFSLYPSSLLVLFLKKSILSLMLFLSRINFYLFAYSADRLGLFLIYCLSSYFCKICRLSLLTQVLRNLTVSSSLIFYLYNSRYNIWLNCCSSSIQCLKLRLSLCFSFLTYSFFKITCSALMATSLLRVSISECNPCLA